MRFIVTIDGEEYELEAIAGNRGFAVRWGDIERMGRLEGKPGSKIYTLQIGEEIFKLALLKVGSEYLVQWRGHDFPVTVERAVARRYRALLHRAASQAHGEPQVRTITSHMPGLIARIFVTEGQRIAAGERLWLLEAMKMENEIRSPSEGVIEKIHVQPGTQVEKGQPVCTIRIGDGL